MTLGTIFWIAVALAIAFEIILKPFGLWRAGRHNQLGWFIVMFIFSTAGILPLIYLLFFQRKGREAAPVRKRRRGK